MNQTSGLLIALPIMALVIALRVWRGSKARKLRIEQMWIRPLIFLVIIGLVVGAQPPPPDALIYAVLVLALAAGIGVGWMRGRMVRVSINPQTHELTSQQSPLAMLIFGGLIALRFGLRYLLGSHAEEWHLSVAAITDGFMIFYGGMIAGMQAEVWLRARKLLADAIAAKAAGQVVPAEVTQDHA